jgi:hypothetical protein
LYQESEYIHDPAYHLMTMFNYNTVAELFPTQRDMHPIPAKGRRIRRHPIGYGRFAHAGYAIRFAIEELPADLLSVTRLQVDDQIFDCDGIRRLYDSEDYPLARRASALPAVNIKHFPND